MSLLTAQKHSWTKQPPYNFYHFPEEHKSNWKKFWEELEGDLDRIIDFADKSGVEDPCEWVESLHRFLFDTFIGDPKVFKKSAESKNFGSFLKEVAKNHQEDPKEKAWYLKRGISPRNFISMMERAAEIKDTRQAVAYINARVVDLGFYLYSEFILNKAPGKGKIKSIASDLNKRAFELEKAVLEEDRIDKIKIGSSVKHSLFPKDVFMVTHIEKSASGNVEMLIVRDQNGRVSFIKDTWNLTL